LVTYYTVFVVDLASRHRVRILGSTPFPNDLFMGQVARTLTVAGEAPVIGRGALIWDRKAKWSGAVRAHLDEAGIRVVDAISGAERQRLCGAVCALH
jgi:hypothetical protein